MRYTDKIKTACLAVQIAVVHKATLGKFPSFRKLLELIRTGTREC